MLTIVGGMMMISKSLFRRKLRLGEYCKVVDAQISNYRQVCRPAVGFGMTSLLESHETLTVL